MEERLHTIRNKVECRLTTVENAATFEGTDFGQDEDKYTFSEDVNRSLRVKLNTCSESEMCFDMSGLDAPIANALRRIMIAEVPTMAIEKVFVTNNTTVIPDEVLVHRLGLVPIKIDPALFEYRGDNEMSESNTIVFELKVTCSLIPGATRDLPDAQRYAHSSVYSGDLVWRPQGDQAERFALCPPRPVPENILLAKLRPGDVIDMELHCEKGIGKEHIKWSPVCPACYRLVPEVEIKKDITPELSAQLAAVCPMHVFDIEDGIAVAARSRNCTTCRECLRHDALAPYVRLYKLKRSYIFSVESTTAIPAERIFTDSVSILKQKATKARELLHGYMSNVSVR